MITNSETKPNIMRNWKIILTLWIALGIAVSGYFYIFPVIIPRVPTALEIEFQSITKETSYFTSLHYHYKVSVLITLVGSIIIFGIGKYHKKE